MNMFMTCCCSLADSVIHCIGLIQFHYTFQIIPWLHRFCICISDYYAIAFTTFNTLSFGTQLKYLLYISLLVYECNISLATQRFLLLLLLYYLTFAVSESKSSFHDALLKALKTSFFMALITNHFISPNSSHTFFPPRNFLSSHKKH